MFMHCRIIWDGCARKLRRPSPREIQSLTINHYSARSGMTADGIGDDPPIGGHHRGLRTEKSRTVPYHLPAPPFHPIYTPPRSPPAQYSIRVLGRGPE